MATFTKRTENGIQWTKPCGQSNHCKVILFFGHSGSDWTLCLQRAHYWRQTNRPLADFQWFPWKRGQAEEAKLRKSNKSSRIHCNIQRVLQGLLPLRMVMLMTVRTSGIWYWAAAADGSEWSQHRLQILDGGREGEGTQQTMGRSTSSLKHTTSMAVRT